MTRNFSGASWPPICFGGRARWRVSKLAAGLYYLRGVWVRLAEQVVSVFGLAKSPSALRPIGVAAILATVAFAALPERQALAQCATTGTDQTCTNPAGTTVTDPGGWGIQDSNSLNLTNFGTVTGANDGIATNNDTIVVNSGTISGGSNSGISTFGIANVTNSGTISGGTYGIIGFNGVNLVNSNSVSGSQYGIYTNVDANVTNSGSISSGFIGISTGNDANVTNSGSITGDFQAISAGNNANVTNSGNISGGSYAGIVASNNATVTNSGNIFGATIGIFAFNNATVINSGTVSSSDIAIYGASSVNVTNSGTIVGLAAVAAGGGGGSTLTNSGTIIGTGGIAIDFSLSHGDTMTFLPGSRVFGEIGLGTGDTVNIRTGRDIAWMMIFGGCSCGAGGIVSTGSTVNVAGGAPYVISGDQIATLDPTAFAMQDRTLTDFTGAISSLLASRFGEFASPGTGGGAEPLAFAPSSGVADGTNAAFAKIAALGYADDGRMANAAATDRASGITVWSKAFAGARHQDADGPSLAATNTVYGGVLGLDKYIAADLRLGAFLGAGTGRLDVDANSQTVKTDYAFGGVYGRFDRSSHFLDFAVSTGHAANDSSRIVADNLAPAGVDTATASYGAWFVSPELAYGLRVPLDNKVTLTPTARLRYVAGFFDGYSESGSAQNLSVSARTVQDLEERFELAFSRSDRVPTDAWLKTTVTVGVLGLERLGSTTIDTVLIGQDLAFAAPGQDTAAGVYMGLGVDYAVTGRVTAFTAFDGTLMTDRSVAGTVKAGLRAAL